jgi:Zn-dependent protease with chaperone function
VGRSVSHRTDELPPIDATIEVPKMVSPAGRTLIRLLDFNTGSITSRPKYRPASRTTIVALIAILTVLMLFLWASASTTEHSPPAVESITFGLLFGIPTLFFSAWAAIRRVAYFVYVDRLLVVLVARPEQWENWLPQLLAAGSNVIEDLTRSGDVDRAQVVADVLMDRRASRVERFA